MKIFYDIDVAVTDTKDNPVTETLQIDKGLITEAGVYYPSGCHGGVYAKIFFQEHQILPRNQEDWTHGDNGWWRGDLYFPVEAAPLNIKVVAYSDCINYTHTITVAIELKPFGMVPAWDKLIYLMTKFLKMMGVAV